MINAIAVVFPIRDTKRRRGLERDIEEAKAVEDEAHKKRLLKEKQRLMGRRIPTKAENEHERDLQIIATKGVVQLFNAVADFQNSLEKEAFKQEKDMK